MRIIWSNSAKQDLLESLEYIANDSLKNADMIREKMYKAVTMLEDYPNMGVLPKDEILVRMGYRMLVVESYLLFYLQKDEEIHITAIKHGTMRYWHLLGKE